VTDEKSWERKKNKEEPLSKSTKAAFSPMGKENKNNKNNNKKKKRNRINKIYKRKKSSRCLAINIIMTITKRTRMLSLQPSFIQEILFLSPVRST
jgi:hypothetical protein